MMIGFLLWASMLGIQAEEPQDFPTVKSDYLYLVDLGNNQTMIDQGSTEKIYPASMTKIMTLIVAIENAPNMDEKITLGSEVFEGLAEAHASVAGFKVGESVSVQDLLYGLFLPSGADAGRALALLEAQGEVGFVKMMNEKAKQLGMNSTNFVNTSGLHDEQHYTTLQDLAVLLQYCLDNATFREIFETKRYTATSASLHPGGLVWESTLFSKISMSDPTKLKNDTIVGGKTGYTNPAGLCLASIAREDGTEYMLITAHAPVSNTPYHIQDAVNLYEYYFTRFAKKQVLSGTDVIQQIPVDYVLFNNKLELTTGKDIILNLLKEEDPASLKIEVNLPQKVQAPIQKDQVMGTLIIKKVSEEKEEILYQQDLLSNQTMKRNPFLYALSGLIRWIQDHVILASLGMLGIILVAICVGDYRREYYRLHTKKKRISKRPRL